RVVVELVVDRTDVEVVAGRVVVDVDVVSGRVVVDDVDAVGGRVVVELLDEVLLVVLDVAVPPAAASSAPASQAPPPGRDSPSMSVVAIVGTPASMATLPVVRWRFGGTAVTSAKCSAPVRFVVSFGGCARPNAASVPVVPPRGVAVNTGTFQRAAAPVS